jgi:hypothetical protein
MATGVDWWRFVSFRLVCPWPAPRSCALPLAKDRHLRKLRDPGCEPTLAHSLLNARPEVTKLYIGNLPFSATEESVRAAFSAHGTVETLSLITDRMTGQPRGFGFVEMSSADASRAIQAMNGADFGGRALKVNEAQDRDRSGGGGGGGGASRGPRRY